MYIISACLVGEKCRYNGEGKETPWVKDVMKKKHCVLVCPEEEGGLTTPRPPAERIGDRIINREGQDVTEEFIRGGKASLTKAEKTAQNLEEQIELAILKANSPSCGCGIIYDGTFTGTQVKGNGVFAAMLLEKGIKVISENQEDEI